MQRFLGLQLIPGAGRLPDNANSAVDLPDGIRPTVLAIIRGGGKRLLIDEGRKVPLTLTDARTIGAGIQLVTFARN